VICVDASVAAKWIFDEDFCNQARALYRDSAVAGERIVAPPLLPIEVTNVVRQRMMRAKPPEPQPLSVAEARQAIESFLDFPVELSLPSQVHQRALDLADAHGLPAIYNAYYVALAELLGCDYWTSDRQLVQALASKLPFVRWIGDYRRGNR
jgi:predicted nucleic acid-binding protein